MYFGCLSTAGAGAPERRCTEHEKGGEPPPLAGRGKKQTLDAKKLNPPFGELGFSTL